MTKKTVVRTIDGIEINMSWEKDVAGVVPAIQRVSESASTSYPIQYLVKADAGLFVSAKVKLEFHKGKPALKNQWDDSIALPTVLRHILFVDSKSEAYMALGDSIPSRLAADAGMMEIKGLVTA